MDVKGVVVKDTTKAVFAAITDLVGQTVLIGIPESKTERCQEITNAALGFIHEFGSPAANIPARPFLIPGVRKAETPALYQLRKAADAALNGDSAKSAQYLNAAGVVGSESARNELNTGDFVPLKPGTIRNRYRSRNTASRRESEQVYLDLVAQGVEPGAAQIETGIQPLVNTGMLRNSITFVVRKK